MEWNHDLDCACYIDGSLKADGSICTSTDPCPCEANGACTCGIGYIGNKCDECKSGFFDLDGNESDSITSCTGKSAIIRISITHTLLLRERFIGPYLNP